MQPKLKLSMEQQREWLRARRQLLEQMAAIREKRDRLALALGLLMLQNRQAMNSSIELDCELVPNGRHQM